MFYLVLQIWFCLLLAAALGAFLMWLVRAWSKEEKASDLVVNWEERLAVARTENHQINSQLQAASAKVSLLPKLQVELDRKHQEVAELSARHESAEAAWIKKYSELETGAQEIRTSLEDQLAQLRGEFAGLANQRDSLAARLDESLHTGAALEREVADAKSQIQEWSTRFAELETASHESRIRLSAVTSECDRLREAATASAARAQEQDDFRRDLCAAQQELSVLRDDLTKANDTENQWREKWHEAENRCERTQAELAALTVRFQQLGEVENEKSRWQSESAAFSLRIAQLDAESAQTKKQLAELGSENERLRVELQNTSDRRDPVQDDALRQRLAAAEQETVNLKSHLATASYLQDEWRMKWHDTEAKFAAAQEQLAAATQRFGSLSGLEAENTRLQDELASYASRYTLLRAEADLHLNKIKTLSDRLAALEPETRNSYDKADNGWGSK